MLVAEIRPCSLRKMLGLPSQSNPLQEKQKNNITLELVVAYSSATLCSKGEA